MDRYIPTIEIDGVQLYQNTATDGPSFGCWDPDLECIYIRRNQSKRSASITYAHELVHCCNDLLDGA